MPITTISGDSRTLSEMFFKAIKTYKHHELAPIFRDVLHGFQLKRLVESPHTVSLVGATRKGHVLIVGIRKKPDVNTATPIVAHINQLLHMPVDFEDTVVPIEQGEHSGLYVIGADTHKGRHFAFLPKVRHSSDLETYTMLPAAQEVLEQYGLEPIDEESQTVVYSKPKRVGHA